MTQQARYPKTVEFLRNALLGKEGFDLALAEEVTQLVLDLGTVEYENSRLTAENETLSNTVELFNGLTAPATPQYPEDFYLYGENEFSHTPSDEEVQEIVDQLYNVKLADLQYAAATNGDTVVIKINDNGLEKILVAKGYADFTIPAEESDEGFVGGADDYLDLHDKAYGHNGCGACPTKTGNLF